MLLSSDIVHFPVYKAVVTVPAEINVETIPTISIDSIRLISFNSRGRRNILYSDYCCVFAVAIWASAMFCHDNPSAVFYLTMIPLYLRYEKDQLYSSLIIEPTKLKYHLTMLTIYFAILTISEFFMNKNRNEFI